MTGVVCSLTRLAMPAIFGLSKHHYVSGPFFEPDVSSFWLLSQEQEIPASDW
jgi:hypothetical protein